MDNKFFQKVADTVHCPLASVAPVEKHVLALSTVSLSVPCLLFPADGVPFLALRCSDCHVSAHLHGFPFIYPARWKLRCLYFCISLWSLNKFQPLSLYVLLFHPPFYSLLGGFWSDVSWNISFQCLLLPALSYSLPLSVPLLSVFTWITSLALSLSSLIFSSSVWPICIIFNFSYFIFYF